MSGNATGNERDLVLITGANGYLAGRLAAHLTQDGKYRVRLTTHSTVTGLPMGIDGAGTEIVPCDLTNGADLERACVGVTHVVHLASVNETACAKDPALAYAINSGGTVNLVRAAENAGVRRFVYLSTAHVYGRPLAGLITEESPTRPAETYAGSHKAAEDFVLYGRRPGAMEAVVLRLSNGTGYPVAAAVQRWTLLVNDLCRQAVERGFVELKSAGLQYRDFICLSDAARAVEHVVELDSAQLGGGVFNLGGKASMTVMQMARIVASVAERELGREVPIVAPAAAPGEAYPELEYSIAKLENTGFQLTGSLEAEIAGTVTLCREAFGSVDSGPESRVAQ